MEKRPTPPHRRPHTAAANLNTTNSYTKEETEKIAFEWQSLLVSAAKGGEPSTYVIEPGIILWSVQVTAKLSSRVDGGQRCICSATSCRVFAVVQNIIRFERRAAGRRQRLRYH
jgi:hypothetical protein